MLIERHLILNALSRHNSIFCSLIIAEIWKTKVVHQFMVSLAAIASISITTLPAALPSSNGFCPAKRRCQL